MSRYYKHSYRLEVNGQNITPKINGRLINMTLTDERGHKSDQLDIVLSDHDGQLEIPPRNASIKVWFGWDSALTYKGQFVLDESSHSGPPDILTLRARASDFKRPAEGETATELAQRNSGRHSHHHSRQQRPHARDKRQPGQYPD